jgi:hypothetical protein
MDYDKLTTEELFEEFKKEYYKASEIANDSLNTTNSTRIHDDLLNLTDLEEYGNKFFLTSQQTEELSKFIEVAKKLDDRLTPTAQGTSFVENFIIEHNEFGTNKTGIKEWEEFSAKAPDNISNIDDDISEADRLRREAEEEITDPPDDLADGDAMTEQFLDDSPDIDRDEILREIEDVDNTPGSDPQSLGGVDPNVDIPDDISEIDQSNIFDEYRKQDPDFDEFMNLIEAEDTQVFGADDRAESVIDNAASALTPDEQSQFINIVDQYNNIADQLPIEETVKKRLRNRMAKLSAQLTTPSGIFDLVDIWETVVLGMGIMVAAAPEIKKTADYYFKSMGKNILNFYGMPTSSIEKEDVNWEHISNTMDVVENLSPTDRLIKMLPDKKDNSYVSNYLPGFMPPQSNPSDVGQTFINTVVNMNKNKANSENQPDKLKETFIYGSTK